MSVDKQVTSGRMRIDITFWDEMQKVSPAARDKLFAALDQAAAHLTAALDQGMDVTVALLPLAAASVLHADGEAAILVPEIEEDWSVVVTMAESSLDTPLLSVLKSWRSDLGMPTTLGVGFLVPRA